MEGNAFVLANQNGRSDVSSQIQGRLLNCYFRHIFIPFTKKRITKTNPFKKLWVSENGLNVSSSQKITLPYCSNTNATYFLRRQENAFVIKNSTREKPGHEPSRKKTEIRHRPQTSSFLQITSASGKQKFLKKRLGMLRVMLKTLNSDNL